MPIDPSIALSYKPVQIQDPMEMYGKRQQIQTNALAMQKYQTESAEKNALAQLISQPNYDPYTPEAQAQAFKVAPNLAPGMFKALQETRAAGQDYETKTQTLADARYKAAQTKVADATKEIIRHDTPESVLADLDQRVAKGDLTQDQANAISSSLPKTAADMPKWQISMLRRSLTAAEQLEQNVQTTDLGGKVQTTVRPKFAGGAAPQVTTVSKTATPGDLLTAAAAARRLAQDEAQFNVTTGLKRQELGQKGKDITAQEGRTAFLAGQILNSATEISNLTENNPTVFKKGMWEAAFGGGALSNIVNPAERQIVSSAIGEITDAALTLATGAAYTPIQLEQKKAFYTPAFTDKPATLEAKKTRFKQLLVNTKKQAGEAWTPEMDAAVAALFPPKASTATVAAPLGAIDMLRKNPNMAPAFDAKYGAGAAKKVLGR